MQEKISGVCMDCGWDSDELDPDTGYCPECEDPPEPSETVRIIGARAAKVRAERERIGREYLENRKEIARLNKRQDELMTRIVDLDVAISKLAKEMREALAEQEE